MRRGFLLLLGTLVLTLAALELALSFRFPFPRNHVPTSFDPRIGSVYDPGAEVRWSNYLDYAVVERVNSRGFIDREPPGPKAPGTFRILVLGDSFVEGRQVRTAEKMHVQLEAILSETYPERRFEAMALGRSGAGTVAELAYYEAYGRAFDPDLVVVVVVQNDFAENSPSLRGISYGYHPDHSPFPQLVEDETGAWHWQPPDPSFGKHQLERPMEPHTYQLVQQRLGWSRLVQWSVAVLRARGAWASLDSRDRKTLRLARLRDEERFREGFVGWEYPNDVDQNQMFFTNSDEMPPAFHDALRAMDQAFGVFAEERRRHGFEMVVAAIPAVSIAPWERERKIVERGMFLHLERITARHGLPLLELLPAFSARGALRASRWRHDAHWSPTGHRWAAETVAEYVAAHADRIGGAGSVDGD